MLPITKRGSRYLRTLLVHGARSTLYHARRKTDPRSLWLQRLQAKRGHNVAAVALANKNARIAWALLRFGQAYRPNLAHAPAPSAAPHPQLQRRPPGRPDTEAAPRERRQCRKPHFSRPALKG